MEFGLSEEQRMLQDAVSGAMQTAAELDIVREAVSGDESAVKGIHDAFASLGTASLLVPEADGGLGMGLLDAALVAEALGGQIVPVPFIAHQMGVAAILSADASAQRTEHIQQIVNENMTLGMAVSDVVARREGAGVTFEKGKLSGKSLFAIGATTATHIIVSDVDGALYLIAAHEAPTQLKTIDKTRDVSELAFDGVEAVALSGAVAATAIRTGRILLAADTLGVCQSMLDKAVAYAKERKQFGRLIGSFQAVKHMCADMAAKLEPSRALMWQAAHAVDTGDDEADVMSCLVKSHLDEVGTYIARTSTEVYGGMGFTDIVGLHYWFKRAGLNRQLLGGPELVRTEAARLQGWLT